ncbi:succinate dehydrogenase iron-sulfur subunit-like [Zerene cesonia]|uniref:succinate dehydrogenase iron-sulfur subunit-like n=1 Tax=Zerene cesonia TaxID=33412 RepID=UPI0018E55ABC|nr:succinate dehydrogenase iron-sulfur subunit-like [Zerene cesonia]
MFNRLLIKNKSPLSFKIIRSYSGHKAPPAKKKDVDPRRVFKVYRFDGILSKGQPKMKNYDLDVSTCGKMVLDAMIKIKDMDSSFVFRRSCREGICGSCAINLQGNNCLACITEIPPDKTISIYPIPHMYVIRDLVVDMTHFFNGYDGIRPYLIRERTSELGAYQYAQSIEDQAKLVGLYECVLCACCSTACPSYWWNGRRFLGPAALLHAYRWIIDSRDKDTAARLYDLRDDFVVYRCHTIMNCTLACPKGLNPHIAIAYLKRLISRVDKKQPEGIDALKFASGAKKKC